MIHGEGDKRIGSIAEGDQSYSIARSFGDEIANDLADGIDTRFGAAWSGFAPNLDRWLDVTEGRGPAAVQAAYLDTLNGRVPPNLGHILSLSE